jgi:uncharacterized membrane protein
MKILHKTILVVAIIIIVINVTIWLSTLIKNYTLRQISSTSEKFLMEQIINTQEQMSNLNDARKLNYYWEQLVSIDSTDISNLISYGTSCFELAVRERDTLLSLSFSSKSIWAAKQLRRVGKYNANALMNAAKLYTFNGLYNEIYYDSCEVIYDRVLHLIEVDSLEILQIALHDKITYYAELKEAIHDYKFYNRMVQRSHAREYIVGH